MPTETPHAGSGPWKAYSRSNHPRGPFRLEFMRCWQDDVPGGDPQTLEEAERVCALLNHAHKMGVDTTRSHIRGVLGL